MKARIWCAGLVAMVVVAPPLLLHAWRGGATAVERVQAGGVGTVWFIRPDGGDRSQCTGMADAAYPGSGSQRACGFKHPYYLFTTDAYNDKGWVVRGGDTILVRGGPYRMGYKGPGAKDYWGSCPGDAYKCYMPSLPSGTQEMPTRLLGEDYASCRTKTQLYGGYALTAILNLQGTRHAVVECLELTDHSECSRTGADVAAADRCSNEAPFSDFAATGILTDAGTSDVVLKNLDIHGLTSRGILGAVGGRIVADHVRIAYNGEAGWDFDDGSGMRSSPDAVVEASYLTVEWNGCNEEYPIAHANPARSCFDQDNGGYGDGVGTPDTALSFTCDHCLFRYNTQDGLDLLHVSGSVIAVTNSTAYGNMGQQWKLGPMRRVVFRNNVTVNNCRRMSAAMAGTPEGYNRGLSLFCRAGGEGFAMEMGDGGEYVVQNNTLAGYGATSYQIGCVGGCGDVQVTFQNNLTLGYEDAVTGVWPAIFDSAATPWVPFKVRDHNIYWHMRSCPWGWTEHCDDPKVMGTREGSGEAGFDSLDLHLSANSPARGAGAVVEGMVEDHDGVSRPVGGAPDIGAFQYR